MIKICARRTFDLPFPSAQRRVACPVGSSTVWAQHPAGSALWPRHWRVHYCGLALCGRCSRGRMAAPARLARGPPDAGRRTPFAVHGFFWSGAGAGGASVGLAAHQRNQRVADAHARSRLHRRAGLAHVRRDHGPARGGCTAAFGSGGRHFGIRPKPGRRQPTTGAAGGSGRDSRLGPGQQPIAGRGRTRPRAGSARWAPRPRCCWRCYLPNRCPHGPMRWRCWRWAPPATD